MKFLNRLAAGAAVYLVPAAQSFASSGLVAESQLTPFANFVVLYLGPLLIAVALVGTALRFAFADRLGDAGSSVGKWLLGAAIIGGGLTGTSWLLQQFSITQGAIF